MAESMGIRTAKSYGKSYGSTKKSTQKTYLTHIVSPSDTFQGLSLKYNVTVEEIKRANKLFANDSIFLRSSLQIPLGDQPQALHTLQAAANPLSTAPLPAPNHAHAQDATSCPDQDQTGQGEGEGTADGEEEVRDETMDFFNRIDRQVREKKSHIKQIEKKTSIGKASSSPSQTSPAFYNAKDGTLPSYHGNDPSFNADDPGSRDLELVTKPDNGDISSNAFDLHPEKL